MYSFHAETFEEKNETTFNGRKDCILSDNFERARHYTIIVVSTEMHVLKYVFTQ